MEKESAVVYEGPHERITLRNVPHPGEETTFERGTPVPLPAGVAASLVDRGKVAYAVAPGGEPAQPQQHEAAVPVLITRKMRRELERRGFTTEQIDGLTPQEAHAKLAE